jgi:hypothetical protein
MQSVGIFGGTMLQKSKLCALICGLMLSSSVANAVGETDSHRVFGDGLFGMHVSPPDTSNGLQSVNSGVYRDEYGALRDADMMPDIDIGTVTGFIRYDDETVTVFGTNGELTETPKDTVVMMLPRQKLEFKENVAMRRQIAGITNSSSDSQPLIPLFSDRSHLGAPPSWRLRRHPDPEQKPAGSRRSQGRPPIVAVLFS